MKNALQRFGIFLGIIEEKKKKPVHNENAIDRDGDGIVQEGTKFERPATPKHKAPAKKPVAKKSTAAKKTTAPKHKKQ